MKKLIIVIFLGLCVVLSAQGSFNIGVNSGQNDGKHPATTAKNSQTWIIPVAVGIAVIATALGVGIAVFNHHAYRANQQAVAEELNSYAALVIQFYRTPEAQGGAGEQVANLSLPSIAYWMGFSDDKYSSTDDTGEYRVTSVSGNIVKLQGYGTEKKHGRVPELESSINVITATITTTVIN
jgi:hypothetical protein